MTSGFMRGHLGTKCHFRVWVAIHIGINIDILSIFNNILCPCFISVRTSVELLNETAVKQFCRFIYLSLFVVDNVLDLFRLLQ